MVTFKQWLTVYKRLKESPNDKYLTTLADVLYTPTQLDITLERFGHTNLGGKSVEAWFTGKCLVIPIRPFLSMVDRLQQLEHPIHPTLTDISI